MPGRTFTASDFAKLSRTTRNTLIHYDEIGLLSPVSRGENNYRYYSAEQLAVVRIIRALQSLGMSLEEIKSIEDERTPENMNELLARQIEHIDTKIDEWIQARKLLMTLTKIINSGLNVDEKKITVQFLPPEAIILGDLNDYSRGRNHYDALKSFYSAISQKYPNLDLNYPVWATLSEERIKQNDWGWSDRYYFANPEGYDRRPAALYAIGYTRCGYDQNDEELYKRMTDYIEDNNLEICGNAYREYPLNEFSIADNTNYLMRLMVTVRPRERGQNPS